MGFEPIDQLSCWSRWLNKAQMSHHISLLIFCMFSIREALFLRKLIKKKRLPKNAKKTELSSFDVRGSKMSSLELISIEFRQLDKNS